MRPRALLDDALVPGIREVGELFRRGDVFLPEMMLARMGLEFKDPPFYA